MSYNKNLSEPIHTRLPKQIDTKIVTFQHEQRIVTKSHAVLLLIKLGLDVYNTYLTGKYINPFEIQPVDPRLVTFVDKLTKQDKERLFYHMLAKLPPDELTRIRELAGIVD